MAYKLDGNDIYATYGVTIEKVEGAFDWLKRKGDTGYSWEDENGEEYFVDVDDIHFEARDIVLKCVIAATSQATFISKLNTFKGVLMASGLRALILPYDPATTYSVYYVSGSSLEMLVKWNATTLAGHFWVKLRQPNPVR